MRNWLKYLGLMLALFAIAYVYHVLFGPILGVAFAATAFLGALGCAVGLERLGYSKPENRARRTVQFFIGFAFLIAFFDPMDTCLDRGGVWDWNSAACDY